MNSSKTKKYYEFLTNPKTVKITAFIGIISFATALIIGIIIAQFDPEGYNLFDHYISDMGSFMHTPFPYLWDFGQMICACLMVPSAFYLREFLMTFAKNNELSEPDSRNIIVLCNISFVWMLMALFGMFMTGFFSLDRAIYLHNMGAYILVGGLVLFCIFLGLSIFFYPSPFPRLLGLYMLICPLIPSIVYFITNVRIAEWIFLISFIVWLIPFALIILRQINNEIGSKS